MVQIKNLTKKLLKKAATKITIFNKIRTKALKEKLIMQMNPKMLLGQSILNVRHLGIRHIPIIMIIVIVKMMKIFMDMDTKIIKKIEREKRIKRFIQNMYLLLLMYLQMNC